jgi:hypothetical protein
MPKRRSDAQYAAALSAGLPPESAKFDDDNEWWDAQDDWLVKDPTGVPEQLSPRGEAQRRKDWQRVTKQHAALFEAATERAANRAVAERAVAERAAAERAAACAEAERAAAKCTEAERAAEEHAAASWAWDNEWQCWYNVEESEQQNHNEARQAAEASQLYDRHVESEVHDWLEDELQQLVYELSPPSYCEYEIDQLRHVVDNSRVLLHLSQAALRQAPASSSGAHLAFLEHECCKAELTFAHAVRRLESATGE